MRRSLSRGTILVRVRSIQQLHIQIFSGGWSLKAISLRLIHGLTTVWTRSLRTCESSRWWRMSEQLQMLLESTPHICGLPIPSATLPDARPTCKVWVITGCTLIWTVLIISIRSRPRFKTQKMPFSTPWQQLHISLPFSTTLSSNLSSPLVHSSSQRSRRRAGQAWPRANAYRTHKETGIARPEQVQVQVRPDDKAFPAKLLNQSQKSHLCPAPFL